MKLAVNASLKYIYFRQSLVYCLVVQSKQHRSHVMISLPRAFLEGACLSNEPSISI
jgi:hypothetical protein